MLSQLSGIRQFRIWRHFHISSSVVWRNFWSWVIWRNFLKPCQMFQLENSKKSYGREQRRLSQVSQVFAKKDNAPLPCALFYVELARIDVWERLLLSSRVSSPAGGVRKRLRGGVVRKQGFSLPSINDLGGVAKEAAPTPTRNSPPQTSL